VQQHDADYVSRFPVALAVQITMSTNKRKTLTAPPDEVCQQFKGRIIGEMPVSVAMLPDELYGERYV